MRIITDTKLNQLLRLAEQKGRDSGTTNGYRLSYQMVQDEASNKRIIFTKVSRLDNEINEIIRGKSK